jgi:hypothetical protein
MMLSTLAHRLPDPTQSDAPDAPELGLLTPRAAAR